MFDDMLIAKTAISSFNNAALFGAYFFAIGLLSIPLFYFVYSWGRDILARLKWDKGTDTKVGFFSVVSLVLWLLLCGGNYAVIRDGISLLPVAISIVLFVSIVFITKQFLALKYSDKIGDKKSRKLIFALLLLLSVFSAVPNVYGILLQLSAVLCGIIVGSRLHKDLSNVFITTLIFGVVTTLILMQPEYFRFGQLGNLTIIHLMSLLLTGFFAITTLMAKYTNARSKIYESAYIKLKWLFRIVASLALILFGLTESVPVFIGLLGVIGISEMLTIYHSKGSYDKLSKQSWAMMLVWFGIIVMCPVISCMGILYLSHLSEKPNFKDFARLL